MIIKRRRYIANYYGPEIRVEYTGMVQCIKERKFPYVTVVYDLILLQLARELGYGGFRQYVRGVRMCALSDLRRECETFEHCCTH